MNSRNNAISKYLEAKQNRRSQAKYRQKRLKMGLPAAVPLKQVSLNQAEKQAITTTEVIGTAKQKRLFVTRHFGWPVSLGVHLLAGVLLTLYAVQEYIPEEPPVSLDFVEPVREPRRTTIRTIKSVKPPDSVQIRAPRAPRSTPKTVEIPREETIIHAPTDDLLGAGEGPAAGSVSIPKGFGNIQVEQKPVKILDDGPKIDIDRSTSITPGDSDLDIGADAGLGDRTIDAEVSVEVDQNPRPLRMVKPKYPEVAKRAQKETTVILEATIGVDGKATDIEVVDPQGFGFDEAAVEALKQSRFTPAKKNGKDVPQRVKIPFKFTLED